ncbi:MAG TPA: 23S rRNA (pseudouridine(1915)-N(3))-methyltransferase RlmH [bacterium]|nr:23S rRNA (pseudouridine(1915)-N(3))-methyltransferase RlmH [bacterium]HOL48459.1 23S rRNA (pseudouridine(1915)-N(3))-methyltransferase RlmH [bacterium]HPQ19963.1 23S rRNA (pseudouridine(1915)-N(3))-methyltransferase RlmH [bacterium]
MKKINIIYQAQIKNQFIKIGVSEYLLRLSKYIKNELNIVKIQEKKIVFEKYKKNKNYNICLTEEGKKFDTINFAQKINGLLLNNDNINFFIGEAEGIEEEIKRKCDLLLSLSDFTFTSEIALLVLSEQLYRIFTIINKHPYHRG